MYMILCGMCVAGRSDGLKHLFVFLLVLILPVLLLLYTRPVGLDLGGILSTASYFLMIY